MSTLDTRYLGFHLDHPVVASAGPWTSDVDSIRSLEDAGVAAVVLASLFEEDIVDHRHQLHEVLMEGWDAHPEASTYMPEPPSRAFGPDEALERVQKTKAAVDIPVIASLNASRAGAWVDYAGLLQQAGADALELNVYFMAADLDTDGRRIEARTLEVVDEVVKSVTIPVAVKLGPYFSAFAHLARSLEQTGAKGLVLFNRFYQPDLDLDTLSVMPSLVPSTSWESRLAMRWIAVLWGRLQLDLAATTGVHNATDALKLMAAGADVTMICSLLLREGPQAIRRLTKDMQNWLEEHEYKNMEELRGAMSQLRCPNPSEFERANYRKVLRSYFA